MEHGTDKRKLAKYKNNEITLADKQYTQMCDVTNAVDCEVLDDLQKIFKKGEFHDVGSKLKEIWTRDTYKA